MSYDEPPPVVIECAYCLQESPYLLHLATTFVRGTAVCNEHISRAFEDAGRPALSA